MKILYVITRGGRGGAQQNVLSLAAGMQRAGHEVMFACGDAQGWLVESVRRLGLEPRHLKALERSWNPLKSLALIGEMRTLVAIDQPDLIHFHSSNSLFGAIGAYILGVYRPKLVFTVHGWSILHPGWRRSTVLKLAYGVVMKSLMRLVDRVIYVCQFDRDWGLVRGLTPAKKSVVIPNGLPGEKGFADRAQARRDLGLADESFTCGTVARFDYPKNLDLLVSALAQCPGLDGVLIGDGPEKNRLTRQINAAGLADRVRLLSDVPEASALMPGLDCFVLCSRLEGLPYAVLEAAAAGTPIVATKVGGVPEIIEHGVSGRLVNPGDAPALAQEIHWVADHREEAARLAEAARDKVQREFSEQGMVKKMEFLYESLFVKKP